jgi:hypothetical protein
MSSVLTSFWVEDPQQQASIPCDNGLVHVELRGDTLVADDLVAVELEHADGTRTSWLPDGLGTVVATAESSLLTVTFKEQRSFGIALVRNPLDDSEDDEIVIVIAGDKASMPLQQ